MRTKYFFLLFLLGACLATPAIAQTKSKQELIKIYEQAESDYKAGRFAEALSGYEELYKETNQSNMLFNIAQCKKELGQFEAAIALYQQFIQEQPENQLRPEIEKTIGELKALLPTPAPEKPPTPPKPNPKKKILLGASGGFLLASAATGVGAIVISRNAQQEGNLPGSTRTKGIILAAASDACLLGFGATLFLGLRAPKFETQISLNPNLDGATVLFSFSQIPH
jgi:tetratricopeptide (TPR) repeat protein